MIEQVWSNMGLVLVNLKDILLHAVSPHKAHFSLWELRPKNLKTKRKCCWNRCFTFVWHMELGIIPLSINNQPVLGEICMQCLQSDWTKTQLCQPKKINKKKRKKGIKTRKSQHKHKTKNQLMIICLVCSTILVWRECEPLIYFFLWIICMGILFVFVKPCQTL